MTGDTIVCEYGAGTGTLLKDACDTWLEFYDSGTSTAATMTNATNSYMSKVYKGFGIPTKILNGANYSYGTTSSCYEDWTYKYSNTSATTTCSWDNGGWKILSDGQCYGAYVPKKVSPSDRLREILGSRHAPIFIPNLRKPLLTTEDIREQRARETLRRVIGENKYFDFLKKGFVSVRAKSGLIYQIFPAHGITAVYDKGIMVDRLCVVLRGDFPPTDSLVMRYLLILNNENQFRSFAVKHGVTKRQDRESIIKLNLEKRHDGKSLADIFKELKKTA